MTTAGRKTLDSTSVQFDSEPLVLGGIGQVVPSSFGSALEGPGLRIVSQTPSYVLFANRELTRWKSGGSEGWFWNPVDRRIRPASRDDVQRLAMASGLTFERGKAFVHNDLLGIQQLHYLKVPAGILFSNWLPILLPMAKDFSPDAVAWTSILLLGSVLPGRSPFTEIRSLPACSSVSVSDGVVRVVQGDLELPPPHGPSVQKALKRGLPRRSLSAAYTLSGGWDSRMLLGLACTRRPSRKPVAWTTNPDDGLGIESELARDVAAYLGVTHHQVTPEVDSEAQSMQFASRRFHHSTWMHTWLEPLAAQLRSRRAVVVDGLGGDVLFKGLYQDSDADRLGRSVSARRALWRRLGGEFAEGVDTWSPAAIELFRDVAFADFEEVIQPFLDSPAWQTLAVLTTRTARAVALSPCRLFGPECEVYLPFVTSDVLAIALSSGVHEIRGPDLYRKLLRSVDERLALLPSTNDPLVIRRSSEPLRQQHPSVARILAEVIGRSEPALQLLSPKVRGAVEAHDIDELVDLMRWTGISRGLRGAFTLASWWSANPGLVRGLVG